MKRKDKKVALSYNFCCLCRKKRKIIAFGDYYVNFMKRLSVQEQQKIRRALLLLETEDKIPYHYISYVRDGLYEFRVTYGSNEYRLFFHI